VQSATRLQAKLAAEQASKRQAQIAPPSVSTRNPGDTDDADNEPKAGDRLNETPAEELVPEQPAPGGVGGCDFGPGWVRSWAAKLPIATTLRMCEVLLPRVEQRCQSNSVRDEGQVLKFIRESTLVGLLPVPHAILVRKYQVSE
jgi:hypothetical protein